jgi:hypothetical protein
MKTIQIESHSGFPLTAALREIVARLNDDDWARWATDDGSSFYYIVGMKAHIEEQAGIHHTSLSVGSGRPVSVVGEHQVHAQVASRRAGDYYQRQARIRLEAAGIGSGQIDRFLDLFDRGDLQGAVAGWEINVPGTDRLDAFCNFLHALAVRRGVDVDTLATDVERKRELDIAVQKVHLDQLSRLFEGIVKRAGSLDTLTFDDAQLNEASRCYLYGFLRAAVVLSSTAVEKCLREAVGEAGLERVAVNVKAKKGGFYSLLVAEATEQHVLGPRVRMGQGPVLASYSVEIFRLRNDVAHKGFEPTAAQAEELLTKARQVVEFVRTHQS